MARLTDTRQLAAPLGGSHFEQVYIIPAILGTLGLLIVAVDVAKMGRTRQ